MDNIQLYKPFKNTGKGNHKYKVYVKRDGKKKLIGFGHKKYKHFKDKLKMYSDLDHNDKDRRKKYRARASKIKNKKGELTFKNKNYSNYWAYHYLW